jgi:hypothetical protein
MQPELLAMWYESVTSSHHRRDSERDLLASVTRALLHDTPYGMEPLEAHVWNRFLLARKEMYCHYSRYLSSASIHILGPSYLAPCGSGRSETTSHLKYSEHAFLKIMHFDTIST